MLAVLKRQWFIVLVAVLLLSTIVFYVYDKNKDNLPSKSVGGKDIVFSVAETDVSADEFYDELYNRYGLGAVYLFFERAVVEASIEGSAVIKTKAEIDSEGVIANFKEYYGTAYETYLIEALKTLGYSKLEDLQSYFEYVYKRQTLMNNSLDAQMDTLFPGFQEVNSPRIVSHVLVTMADPNAPTAEETQRFEAAKAALAAGMSFEDMVINHSNDTSNNTLKGLLGYVDKNTSFVPEFLSAALALGEGEVSDWVKTSYGYHLIRVDSISIDRLKQEQAFYDALLKSDASLEAKIIWSKAEELGVVIEDENLKAELLAYMGIEE